MLKYSFERPAKQDLFALCMLIKLFEGPISVMLKNNDQLVTLSRDQVKIVVEQGICSQPILAETSQTIHAILHDCIKDGLPAILNKIQLSKNRQMRSEHSIADNECFGQANLFVNGLNYIIETTATTNQESLNDMELYASLMENLSEIQMVEARIENKVDQLIYEDNGFLKPYEDFSFCSTAQVSSGNITQM